MTILQGVRAFLDGSVVLGAGDADGGDGGGASAELEDQSPVEVVFKKGIRVNGANEHDRDAALSEVSSVGFSFRFQFSVSVFGFSFRFQFSVSVVGSVSVRPSVQRFVVLLLRARPCARFFLASVRWFTAAVLSVPRPRQLLLGFSLHCVFRGVSLCASRRHSQEGRSGGSQSTGKIEC